MVDIVVHSHNASVSPRTQAAARRGLEKLGKRLTRTSSATVLFEEDGPMRRVELVMQASRRRLVAEGTARFYGPALTIALAHLETQIRRLRRQATSRSRRPAKA